jgi:Tfp pilus assembly protein FimT
VELLVVIVILAIAGLAVIPMISSTGDLQAVSAARIITTDLQYAQNVAITTQELIEVTFDPAADKYDLVSKTSGVLKHPMTKNDYVTSFQGQKNFDQVDIVSASFGGSAKVTFDELGSPDNGGSVTVRAGPTVHRVDVAPITGLVTVTQTGP